MNKVLLAPTKDLAESIPQPEATVEAEYGNVCIDGSKITLAHHTEAHKNDPAPCNSEVDQTLDEATILVSHIDLDTLGGIFAISGEKMEDPAFWEAAEFIDLNGPHHIHELDQAEQDKLNAFYAWEQKLREFSENKGRYPRDTITDVTRDVADRKRGLEAILDERHPDHDVLIEAGRIWEERSTAEIESKLVAEDRGLREFSTDGVFCAAAYYSPGYETVMPATITFNERFNAITVAFEDGGKKISAKEFVQSLWGPEAGGHDGIAGSPRGQVMTMDDFSKAADKLAGMVAERYPEYADIGQEIEEDLDESQDAPSAPSLFDDER